MTRLFEFKAFLDFTSHIRLVRRELVGIWILIFDIKHFNKIAKLPALFDICTNF
jgi:hypothetical protein